MNELRVPVSPGELLDKLTILRIKAERIAAPEKRVNVARELARKCARSGLGASADAAQTARGFELGEVAPHGRLRCSEALAQLLDRDELALGQHALNLAVALSEVHEAIKARGARAINFAQRERFLSRRDASRAKLSACRPIDGMKRTRAR